MEEREELGGPLREEDVTRGDKLDDTVQEGAELPEAEDE